VTAPPASPYRAVRAEDFLNRGGRGPSPGGDISRLFYGNGNAYPNNIPDMPDGPENSFDSLHRILAENFARETTEPSMYRDITPERRDKIIKRAGQWKRWNGYGVPYRKGGSNRETGADCSGAIWGIYNEAGLRYDRCSSGGFGKNDNFKAIPFEDLRPADVVVYKGHAALYKGEENGKRKVYSAHHTDGVPFGEAGLYDFGIPIAFYRYYYNPSDQGE
jgi:hypothetical protein